MEPATSPSTIISAEVQQKQLSIDEFELKPTRVITWETNFNNKLGCKAFTHIDLAPCNANIHLINKMHMEVTEDYILRKQVVDKLIEIRTADKSHPAVKAYVKDMLIIPYQKVSDWIAWTSHGMNDLDLANYFFDKYNPDFSWTTEMAVYFYLSALY